MSGLVTYVVDCFQADEILASYEFTRGTSLAGAPPAPNSDVLIGQAKSSLAQQHPTLDPYVDVKYRVRRKWS